MLNTTEVKLGYTSCVKFVTDLYSPDRVVDPVIFEIYPVTNDTDYPQVTYCMGLSFYLVNKDQIKLPDSKVYKIFGIDKDSNVISMHMKTF